MNVTAQILHSGTTGTGSVSGLTVEMYEMNTDTGGSKYVVEIAGTPIVEYDSQAEARGVFYLLSNIGAETAGALIANAAICDAFPVQS